MDRRSIYETSFLFTYIDPSQFFTFCKRKREHNLHLREEHMKSVTQVLDFIITAPTRHSPFFHIIDSTAHIWIKSHPIPPLLGSHQPVSFAKADCWTSRSKCDRLHQEAA